LTGRKKNSRRGTPEGGGKTPKSKVTKDLKSRRGLPLPGKWNDDMCESVGLYPRICEKKGRKRDLRESGIGKRGGARRLLEGEDVYIWEDALMKHRGLGPRTDPEEGGEGRIRKGGGRLRRLKFINVTTQRRNREKRKRR